MNAYEEWILANMSEAEIKAEAARLRAEGKLAPIVVNLNEN